MADTKAKKEAEKEMILGIDTSYYTTSMSLLDGGAGFCATAGN